MVSVKSKKEYADSHGDLVGEVCNLAYTAFIYNISRIDENLLYARFLGYETHIPMKKPRESLDSLWLRYGCCENL